MATFWLLYGNMFFFNNNNPRMYYEMSLGLLIQVPHNWIQVCKSTWRTNCSIRTWHNNLCFIIFIYICGVSWVVNSLMVSFCARMYVRTRTSNLFLEQNRVAAFLSLHPGSCQGTITFRHRFNLYSDQFPGLDPGAAVFFFFFVNSSFIAGRLSSEGK